MCYKMADEDFVSKLGNKITPQEFLICSLIHNDFSKENIINVLSLSNDAFRKLKSRTLIELQNKDELRDICDILSAF